MPSIDHKLDIHAPPEKIFDLISRVEDFKKYSKLIREVRTVAPNRFHWRVEYLGISFEWESEITVFDRPKTFAWESKKGVYTSGSYTLTPTPLGTCVEFKMEFHLPNRLTEIFTAPIMARIRSSVNKELLQNIKRELDLAEDVQKVDECKGAPPTSP
jgi:uncharacterized membrane protein